MSSSKPPRRPPPPPSRKASSAGFQATNVTEHLATPAVAGIPMPTKDTARTVALDMAKRCCRSGDTRELAQALVMLIESLP